MLVTRSRTCYQLDGVLIKQGTSTYWHHVQGEHLSWGRNGWGGRAEQAVCQHLPIWPAFVFRRQTLLSGTHLRNHAMVIRHNPIKKSNQREYIIIEMIFIWEGRKRPTVETANKKTDWGENSAEETADWWLMTSAVQPQMWKLEIRGAIKWSIHGRVHS